MEYSAPYSALLTKYRINQRDSYVIGAQLHPPERAVELTEGKNQTLTMSSREIAEITGKRHDNVLRDTRTMLEELGGGVLSFEAIYINPQNGQIYTEFLLPKDLTITLVSGYSTVMRHRIVTRWFGRGL